jgi:hypothetical protein
MIKKSVTRKYTERRNELADQVREGILTIEGAEISLAGFLLKQYDNGQRGNPVFTHGQTLHDNCLYNAKNDLAMGLE